MAVAKLMEMQTELHLLCLATRMELALFLVRVVQAL